MTDARARLPFVLIALGGHLTLSAAAVPKVWLRHAHNMYAGDSTKKRRPPRHPSS